MLWFFSSLFSFRFVAARRLALTMALAYGFGNSHLRMQEKQKGRPNGQPLKTYKFWIFFMKHRGGCHTVMAFLGIIPVI